MRTQAPCAREAATERPGALNRTIARATAVAHVAGAGRCSRAEAEHASLSRAPDQRFLLSSFRTVRNRKRSQLTLKLAGSAVAVAAFASGATAAALAGPAGPAAAPHAADVPAGPVGVAGQPAAGPACGGLDQPDPPGDRLPGRHRAARRGPHPTPDRPRDAVPVPLVGQQAVQVPELAVGAGKRLEQVRAATPTRARTASPRRCPAARWPARAPTGGRTRPPRSAGGCVTSRPGTGPRSRAWNHSQATRLVLSALGAGGGPPIRWV